MPLLIRITIPKIGKDVVTPVSGHPELKELSMEEVEFQIMKGDVSERVLDRLAFFNIGKKDDSSIM
ncbi:hypothetical protein Ciccas_004041 [Cichlidogyrus casuarinus]|uniref:Uncharacterized protein n=1 Tax=Cichlidogyrus casuarinus TaxID=1844966 RepID=A0ABD2QCP0_9PLAT